MRIKLISILLLYIGLTVIAIGQKRPDSIVGKWVSPDDVRTVRVFKEDNKYKADIIKSNNPDEIGKLILWNLVYDLESREWNDGKIQLPGMSHDVDCYIKMINTDSIKITGYHGLRVLGKSELYFKSQ
ncbi:MAG: DUF2147 domain-containing protein [Cyclobacteriaceae bacterium]